MDDLVPIQPFRCLGYLNGTYYYYSRGEQAVVSLTALGHQKNSFYRLAPHEHWVEHFPAGKDGEFLSDRITANLMATCQKAGIFNIERIRGRGVWMNGTKPVIHYGDRVTIGKKSYLPYLAPDKAVYELADPLGIKPATPLSDEEGKQFSDLIKKLKWSTPDQFMWFSGWLSCAMIGGALYWRPHIWITGPAQSGKSTLNNIIKKILGQNCLYIQSVSTEAGIRQTLGADAIPVVMDEAEREDNYSHHRIQSILTLARQASCNSDSKIVKGSPTGKALNYMIRSPFCLSSITAALLQTADKGRFSQLELSPKKLSGDEFKQWQADMEALLTTKYINRFHNRIIKLLPVILHNAKVLTMAIEKKTGDRRIGDQYGALLSGHIAMQSSRMLTDENAAVLIENINFTLELQQATARLEHFKLIDSIMQHVVKVPLSQGYDELTIGELCSIVRDKGTIEKDYITRLANYGIKVLGESIYIANDNKNLEIVLKNTNWPTGWNNTLKLYPGATSSDKVVYFSPACKQRATLLPINTVLASDE